MGSVVKRKGKDRKTGKEFTQYHIVFYTGDKRWSDKKNAWVAQQKWEKVPPELNTKRGARRLLAQRETEVQQGTYLGHRKILFADLADDWLEKEVGPTAKEQTVMRYRSILECHLKPAFGSSFVDSLRNQDIQAFVAQKIEEGLSGSYVGQLVVYLRSIFRTAIHWEYLVRNPAERIKIPTQQSPEILPLDPSQVRRLLEHAPSPYYALLVTAIWTGMRLGELMAARWANLDEEGKRYFVRENMTKAQTFSAPKSPASRKPVPLSPFVLKALQQHRKEQTEYRLQLGDRYQDQDLIFPNSRGNPRSHNEAYRKYQTILKDASLPPARFHDLRHTCASLMIKNGESPKTIQLQMRHTSIKMTFDIYGHLFPEDKDDAVARLDDLIWKKPRQHTRGSV